MVERVRPFRQGESDVWIPRLVEPLDAVEGNVGTRGSSHGRVHEGAMWTVIGERDAEGHDLLLTSGNLFMDGHNRGEGIGNACETIVGPFGNWRLERRARRA